MSEWFSAIGAIGEFVIAGVIYYEIEAGRVSSFLTGVHNDEFYKGRKRLYEAYVRVLPEGASLKERAEAFRQKLWDDECLRTICDQQWTHIDRLRYTVQGSIFRRVVAKWFPQVLVSLWVMTNTVSGSK
jgi:hypothetical protein